MALIPPEPFSKWFYLPYIIGGLSDVLDGIVARHFGQETKFGAKLDTFADIFFVSVILIKVWKTFHVPVRIYIWISGIALIKAINLISGIILYKQFVSEHTAMNKIAGVFVFAIPLCGGRLFDVMIIITCFIATIAAVQEGYYIHIGKIIS